MKDIFMCLLMNLRNHGKITSASMVDETFIKIVFIDGDSEYDVCVFKKEKGEKKDA